MTLNIYNGPFQVYRMIPKGSIYVRAYRVKGNISVANKHFREIQIIKYMYTFILIWNKIEINVLPKTKSRIQGNVEYFNKIHVNVFFSFR